MNCESVHESLVALLDGEVTTAERRLLEEHLATCAACRRERALLERTRTLVTDRLRRTAAEPGSFEALWQRIEAASPEAGPQAADPPRLGARPGRGRRPRRTAAWAAVGGFAAAAGLALALVGLPGEDAAVPPAGAPAPRAAAPRAPREPVAVARAPSRPDGGQPAAQPGAAAPAKTARQAAAGPPADEPAPGAAGPVDEPDEQEVLAVALGRAEPPRELLERPELFVNYPILSKLDELRHLDTVLAESPDDGSTGGAG